MLQSGILFVDFKEYETTHICNIKGSEPIHTGSSLIAMVHNIIGITNN
jgi:hypothetical protein